MGKRAAVRERKVAAAVGGSREPRSGAERGVDVSGSVVWIEETSNLAIVRGIKRWWESKAVTRKVRRLHSQSVVPSALVLSWAGKAQLVAMRAADFYQIVSDQKDEAMANWIRELKSVLGRMP